MSGEKSEERAHPVLDRIDAFILGFAAAALICIVLMLVILEEELHKRTFILPSAVGVPLSANKPLHEVPRPLEESEIG